MKQTTEPNAEILMQIAEDVRNAPPEMFDLAHWDCGTTACAIGWHVRFHPNCGIKLGEPWLYGETNSRPLSFEGKQNWSAICAYVNLKDEDADFLFDRFAYDEDAQYPAYVAARIEQFVRDRCPGYFAETPVIEPKVRVERREAVTNAK